MADGTTGPEPSAAPHSIEAEQALLGAILNGREVFDDVAEFLRAEHFYEPTHGRIWDCIATRLERNMLANHTAVATYMKDDAGLKELGGAAYLARLSAAAISAYAAVDYARIVYDLALRRELIRVGSEIADRAARVSMDDEPAEMIVDAEQRLYAIAEKGRRESSFQRFGAAVKAAIDVAYAAYQRDGGLAGISTGLIDLDRKLGGLHPSDLLIIAGRPSMGKTSLATNIAFSIARAHRIGTRPDGSQGTVDGGVVGFFSLEMSAEQLAARILSEQAEIPSEQIRRGEMTEDAFRRLVEAANALHRIPLFIDDTPALTIAQLSARARRLKRQHGLDVLFVDYLQLVRPARSRASDNRVNEVAEITQGLKAIAKELDIPVVALSQLSRQVEAREDKRPQLSDLRESGSIEQDADVVMFVFREEYYKEREKPSDSNAEALIKWQEEMDRVTGKAEVIIGKQRHGPIGTVELSFDGRFTRFGNLEKFRQPL
ncbi:MAG: replicative DNA helicase [Alphaproteobacteria bacterium]|nr:MAG: replicative DNA helicase [Alphaproteobacteria bacterium]